MALNNIIHSVSSLVCHQNPERCFIIGNKILTLCTRCTGIYSGFLLSFLFMWFTAARKKFLDYEKQVWLLSGVILAVFLIEGVLSFKNILNMGNNIRFVSGLYGGASLGILSFYLFNSSLGEKKYFTKTKFTVQDFLLNLLIIFVMFSVKIFINVPFAFYLWMILSFGGLLFTYTMVNLTVVAVFAESKKRNKKSRFKTGLYTLILISAEFLILYLLNR